MALSTQRRHGDFSGRLTGVVTSGRSPISSVSQSSRGPDIRGFQAATWTRNRPNGRSQRTRPRARDPKLPSTIFRSTDRCTSWPSVRRTRRENQIQWKRSLATAYRRRAQNPNQAVARKAIDGTDATLTSQSRLPKADIRLIGKVSLKRSRLRSSRTTKQEVLCRTSIRARW